MKPAFGCTFFLKRVWLCAEPPNIFFKKFIKQSFFKRRIKFHFHFFYLSTKSLLNKKLKVNSLNQTPKIYPKKYLQHYRDLWKTSTSSSSNSLYHILNLKKRACFYPIVRVLFKMISSISSSILNIFHQIVFVCFKKTIKG